MKKDTPISLRVRRDQLNKIKELGFKYTDVWDLGFERILENEREELEKLAKKYHDLYIHVNTKLKNFGKKLESEKLELDRLLVWYKKQNRNVSIPTQQDIDALKLQIKKKEINSFTVDQVFEYWKSNGGE